VFSDLISRGEKTNSKHWIQKNKTQLSCPDIALYCNHIQVITEYR